VSKTPIPAHEILVERELCVADASKKVLVQIGIPKNIDADEAICAYRLICGGTVVGIDAHGVDPFQALQLALKTIPIELRHNKLLPLGKMYWFELGDDMGFSEKDGWP
jgi:hypothetical protein